MARTNFTVAEIVIEGLQRVSEGTVYNYLPVNIGDNLSPARVREALKALYGTGFFRDVELRRDGNTLVVVVRERPSIESFEVKGNKDIKTEDLTKSLRNVGLSAGKTFDRSVLEDTKQYLTDQYYSRGKYGVRIDATVEDQPDNRVRVKIDIKEGSRAKIRQIGIVGNTRFKEKEILETFELKTPGWLSWYKQNDRYSRESLQGDLEKLRSFYQDRGYANMQIESAQVAIAPEKDDMFVTISVQEGEVYKIGDVKLAGNTIVPEAELRKLLLVQPGQIYSQKQIAATQELIQNRLGQDGYAFAKVDPVPKQDEARKEVALTFLVEPGKRVYVRHINFAGINRTNDEVLRREVRQMEGAWVSNAALERSKQRIQRLPYIEKVEFTKEKVDGADDLVDVEYTIKEGPSAQLSGGIGYSESQNFSLNGNLTDSNFLGTGKRVALDLQTGYYSQIYSFSRTNPYLTLDELGGTFNVSYTNVRQLTSTFSDFSTKAMLLGGELGYPLSERQYLRFGGSLQYVEYAIPLNTSEQLIDWVHDNGDRYFRRAGSDYVLGTTLPIAEISSSWAFDSRDRTLFPTTGALHRLSLTSTIPGSGAQFATASYQLQQFVRLPGFDFLRKMPLSVSVRFNYGHALGDTTALPPNRHFFVGGPDSVRGFRESTLGPRDSLGNPYGGDAAVSGQLEAILPMPKKFATSARVAAFFDFGQAFSVGGTKFDDRANLPTSYRFDFNALRTSAGIAVQWLAPLGLFRFSYAIPLIRQRETWRRYGDEIEAFQFSVGNAF